MKETKVDFYEMKSSTSECIVKLINESNVIKKFLRISSTQLSSSDHAAFFSASTRFNSTSYF